MNDYTQNEAVARWAELQDRLDRAVDKNRRALARRAKKNNRENRRYER